MCTYTTQKNSFNIHINPLLLKQLQTDVIKHFLKASFVLHTLEY